ncbi:MAG: GHKL domain-containing protein [Endomicrobium sp.]|jgi:signal transduction histidine kinase|nr:GHKL domain-containing protein [Endomicrobium sp.]
MESVDKEIISFMKKDAKNVNFFVIDKHGNHIYKNYALNRIVGNTNAKRLNPKTWEISCEVMRTGKQIITEEQSLEGNDYLTIKSPLVINSKVEGVIGLAVDITDKKKREYAEKKKEELENKLKMKEELYNVARYVAHDLAQPVNVLKGYLDLNKSLKEKEKKIFGEVARSIENITDRLLIKYRGVKDIKEKSYIFVKWCLDKVVKQIREQKKEIEIKRVFNREEKFVFIKGNFVDFSRMVLNLVNNGIESVEGKKADIEISYEVKGEEVEIRVKDNGKGKPKEMAEKLVKGEKVETTKKGGHGMGTQQINSAVRDMNGKLKIETKENEGTEVILTFPKAEKPRWVEDKIEIKKGNTLVILDHEELVHKHWQEKLKMYEKKITIKYFTQGKEALKYLKSLENKEKVFLIADYELKEDINGIDVIDKASMKERHLLVTNMYLSDIKEFNKKSGYIKIFHKMHINDISLKVN